MEIAQLSRLSKVLKALRLLVELSRVLGGNVTVRLHSVPRESLSGPHAEQTSAQFTRVSRRDHLRSKKRRTYFAITRPAAISWSCARRAKGDIESMLERFAPLPPVLSTLQGPQPLPSTLATTTQTLSFGAAARNTSTPGAGGMTGEGAGKYPMGSFRSIRLQRDGLLNLCLDLQLE